MKTWRVLVVPFVLIGLLSGLIYRLYQIQVSSTHSFSVAQKDLIALAEKVQTREVILNSNRGQILDRHGRSFVGETKWRLFVFPHTEEQLELQRPEFSRLSAMLHRSYQKFKQELLSLRQPAILSSYVLTKDQVTLIEALHIPGIIAVESDNRMTDGEVAKQVLGRLVRNSFVLRERYSQEVANGKFSLQSRFGITGLEYAFESFLHGEGESLIRFVTDGQGKALNGVQVKLRKEEPKQANQPDDVITTLDIGLQSQVEQILAKEQVTDGAVVVQEIATGNILAMAGNSNKAEQSENQWINEALVEATPGSIFKIIVTIAALEEGIITPNSLFVCKGTLGRYGLHDSGNITHGRETFAEAFADSCNIALGSLAEKLGGEKIQTYARRLGLDQKIIWTGKVLENNHFSQLSEENTGLIFATSTSLHDKGVAVQTGIGQHDVKVTPLQAANMVTALFHKGMPIQPRLVTEIRDANGKPVWKFTNKYLPNVKPFKTSTLTAVKRMMRMVVTSGTARSLSGTSWQLAGKTGTAQIGLSNQLYNKWMIGFAPYTKPLYSVSVVIKKVKDADDPRAKRIFQAAMEILRKMEETK
jgi:cell division protein FtsI/penicillin-binding protein 2